jgi:hypothetical protein
MLRTYKYRIYPRQHSSGTCGGCGYVLDELDSIHPSWEEGRAGRTLSKKIAGRRDGIRNSDGMEMKNSG